MAAAGRTPVARRGRPRLDHETDHGNKADELLTLLDEWLENRPPRWWCSASGWARTRSSAATEGQLAGLFQPFNRLGREGGDIAGTGIGMVLVRQLAELMGGSISVTSEAGAGTIVRLEVPRPKIAGLLLDGVGTATMPAILSADSQATTGTNPCGLVLYIEDNPVNVLVVEQMLGIWAAVQVVVAEDGESGIRQATALRSDVVLLDMQLPDMTGLEVLKALKGNASTRDLCVVALSGSAVKDEVCIAEEAGALDYWTKPVDMLAFREGMRKLLQR